MDETSTYGDDYVWVLNPEQHPADTIGDTDIHGETPYEGDYQPFTRKGHLLVRVGEVDATRKEGLHIGAKAFTSQIPEGYAARVPNGFDVEIDPSDKPIETTAYITGNTDYKVILGAPDASQAQDWVGRFFGEETIVSTPFYGEAPLVEEVVPTEELQDGESPNLGGVERFLDGGPT